MCHKAHLESPVLVEFQRTGAPSGAEDMNEGVRGVGGKVFRVGEHGRKQRRGIVGEESGGVAGPVKLISLQSPRVGPSNFVHARNNFKQLPCLRLQS